VQHSKELLGWVAESGKNLTSIYVTHAHGDHFFGLKFLLDRFPNARAFATASVVAAMQRREPIGAVSLLFRYGENSGDSTHAEPHFRTSGHYQIFF
jgi:glyoxylase-like metal-dependent hydrolase (beta-lactamase superfamily II)